eukprot:TRINITY_DN2911_c0_g1_i1.p1 TRINITY_DN2911_c0_g1~~TRINITY_DN2911_c0_g1_i1.p1  ORF type:complete len:588 (-),score=116.63 TRINITY_DN2911_c0_g1_i1:432-2195(-)
MPDSDASSNNEDDRSGDDDGSVADPLADFLSEYSARSLLDWLHEQGYHTINAIATLDTSVLIARGVDEEKAHTLIEEAREAVDGEASSSEDEEFTEADRAPAGKKVDKVRLPDAIQDYYTFLELVHDPGGGRCVFLCEHVEIDPTAVGAALSRRGSMLRKSFTHIAGRASTQEDAATKDQKKAAEKRISLISNARLKPPKEKRKKCILKVYRKDAWPKNEMDAWLKLQLRMLAMTRHPNVLLPRRIVEDERAYYVEYDLVRVGCSMLQMILNDASATEKQLRKMVRGILRGLNHLHEHHLVHRDLTPENVLVEWRSAETQMSKNARPPRGWRSTKHGIRRWRPAGQFKSSRFRHDLPIYIRIIDLDTVCDLKDVSKGTCTPVICGTPGYMAPECYTQTGGMEADLWGVGMILYLWVRCEAPFHDAVFKAMRGQKDDRIDLISSDVRQRIRAAVETRVGELEWDEKPWDGLPLCRDMAKRLLDVKPEIRGSDAAEVLQVSPWFHRVSADYRMDDLAQFLPTSFTNKGIDDMDPEEPEEGDAAESLRQSLEVPRADLLVHARSHRRKGSAGTLGSAPSTHSSKQSKTPS